MMDSHPTRDALDRFIRGLSTDDEAEPVERHLLERRCFDCILELRKVMAEAEVELRENVHRSLQGNELPDEEKDESFEAAFRQAQRRGTVAIAEHDLGPTLLAELLRRAPAARREVIRTAERYQLFGFAEYLSLESREAVFHDVAHAQELAELAIEVAEALDPRIYVPVFTADQQALAHACLGNVRRVSSDLFGAERCFQHAISLQEHTSPGSPVRAEVGSLLGSLRIDQGRYYEARTILREARKIFRVFQLWRQEGKVLMQLANAEGYAGEPEKAVALLDRAIPVLEKAHEERLLAFAHRNLTDWMIEAGQALEALARYEKARELYDQHFQEPSLRLRRRWLEGRIYAALGDSAMAIAAFEEVRETAARSEHSYDLAMVSLELALVHLGLGRADRVQDLAEEITPIFRSHELHRHALAAMTLFRQAARSQTASTGLVQEILRYLQRARNNPYERFEPSARWG
jgi:tetratricopeptide (TPR) repeat protein